MSPLLELLPSELKGNIALAFRGLSTFFHPSRYINLLGFEKPIVIFIRYIIASLAFSVLQVIVFTASSKPISFWMTSFKVLFFDIIFSMILFPVFWIPLKILKHEHPVKIIFGYMFLLRNLLLVPTIIFYGVFISSEAYFWAATRGIFFYIAILLLLILPPVNSFNRTVKKISALVCTFIAYLMISFSFFNLLQQYSHNSDTPIKMLLLYDPISAEIDEKLIKFDELSELNFYPTSFKSACDLVFQATPSPDGKTLRLNKENMLNLQSLWQQERGTFYSQISKFDIEIIKIYEQCEFETSKKMLEQDRESINQSRLIASLLDDYIKEPSAKKLSAIIPEYIKLQRSCNTRSSLTLNHYHNILPLLKFSLLFY